MKKFQTKPNLKVKSLVIAIKNGNKISISWHIQVYSGIFIIALVKDLHKKQELADTIT